MLTGTKVSDGVAIAKAYVVKHEKIRFDKYSKLDEIQERQRLLDAIDKFEKNMLDLISKNKFEESEILEIHIQIAREMIPEIEHELSRRNITAEYALNKTFNSYIDVFERLNDETMSQRIFDFMDIKKQLLKLLKNINQKKISDIENDCIIVKKEFTPSDLFNIDKNKIKGLISQTGNFNSHAAIIARAMEIPAIFSVNSATKEIASGDELILNANENKIFVNPPSEILNQTQKLLLNIKNEKSLLEEFKDKITVTCDNQKVCLCANINNLNEIDTALEKGIDAVGLFRSEFLFIERSNLPSEQEQFEIYKAAAQKLKGKYITIRTLDIGGDKRISSLNIKREDNSFLGHRAIRFCLDNENIFRTQIRAILRASAFGKIKLMIPMISVFEELIESKKIISAVKTELEEEKISFDKQIQIGIMIETPSAVLIANDLAKECDFFSLGTNDLIQYTMSAARDNPKVSYLYSPFQPAVIKNIIDTINAARNNNIDISICGEAATHPLLIPLFLSAQLKTLSMLPSQILPVKKLISQIDLSKLDNIIANVLKMKSKSEIKDYLQALSENILDIK
jgi:phosphoenolpyruvate-protein phosphotransferase